MSASPPSSSQSPTPCRKVEPVPASGIGRLNAIPPGVQAGVVLMVVVVGVWIGGPIGGGLLLVVAAAMFGALALAWRVIAVPERLLRFALAFLIVGLALVRVFPR